MYKTCRLGKEFLSLGDLLLVQCDWSEEVLGELKRDEVGKIDRGCLLFTH